MGILNNLHAKFNVGLHNDPSTTNFVLDMYFVHCITHKVTLWCIRNGCFKKLKIFHLQFTIYNLTFREGHVFMSDKSKQEFSNIYFLRILSTLNFLPPFPEKLLERFFWYPAYKFNWNVLRTLSSSRILRCHCSYNKRKILENADDMNNNALQKRIHETRKWSRGSWVPPKKAGKDFMRSKNIILEGF